MNSGAGFTVIQLDVTDDDEGTNSDVSLKFSSSYVDCVTHFTLQSNGAVTIRQPVDYETSDRWVYLIFQIKIALLFTRLSILLDHVFNSNIYQFFTEHKDLDLVDIKIRHPPSLKECIYRL